MPVSLLPMVRSVSGAVLLSCRSPSVRKPAALPGPELKSTSTCLICNRLLSSQIDVAKPFRPTLRSRVPRSSVFFLRSPGNDQTQLDPAEGKYCVLRGRLTHYVESPNPIPSRNPIALLPDNQTELRLQPLPLWRSTATTRGADVTHAPRRRLISLACMFSCFHRCVFSFAHGLCGAFLVRDLV